MAGAWRSGTYVGNGLDNQYKNQVGFFPEWVLVKKDDIDTTIGPGEKAVTHKPASTGVNTDIGLRFSEIPTVTDTIQKLLPLGFEVGTDDRVNRLSDATCRGGPSCTYHWVAFGPHLPQTNYRSIGTRADYGTTQTDGNGSSVTATQGSTIVTGSGIGALAHLQPGPGRRDRNRPRCRALHDRGPELREPADPHHPLHGRHVRRQGL